jgi:hypothetical protein
MFRSLSVLASYISTLTEPLLPKKKETVLTVNIQQRSLYVPPPYKPQKIAAKN